MGEPNDQSRGEDPHQHSSVQSGVPFASNPVFAANQPLLNEIRERLGAQSRVVLAAPGSRPRTQCLTEFAVEAAYHCRDDFDSVWWIPGGCPAAVPGAFAEIAHSLELPEAEGLEQKSMIAAVQKRLAHDERTLFIFDSINETEEIDALLPPDATARVLLTGTPPVPPHSFSAVEVGDLHPDISLAFLKSALGGPPNAVDEECAFHLGGIPLLLHLYAGCVGLVSAKKKDLQAVLAKWSDERSQDDKGRIRMCLDLLLRETLAVLKETHALASNLFALCAFLGPHPLPNSAIFDGMNYLPQTLSKGLSDRNALPAVLGILSKAGLARTGAAAFAIPAVLQERFVSLCPQSKKEGWCSSAVGFMANLFPFREEHSHFDLQCSRLLGHASVVASWSEQIGCSLEDAGRLLNQLGLYLRACGQHEEAIKYYLHAVACGESINGADHPKVAVRINNLGVVYRETGRLDEARDAFRRAIRIIKDAYGPADHMLAMAVRNLVAVAEDSKDEEDMERSYRRALRIYADALGQAHPYVHECLFSLGRILRKHDNIKDAKRCFKEALRCALLCSPVDEEAVALYSRNLGRLLLRTGEGGEALEHLQTSVALQRKLGGHGNESLAESLYELGHAYRREKQYPEARKSLEEALRIVRGSDTNGGLQTRILNQLGRVMRAQGDPGGAATCYRQICRLHEEAGGAENPELVASLVELGNVLEELDNPIEAEQCFSRALELEKKQNTGDASAGMLYYRIGAIKRELGQFEEALEMFKQAMSADTREHGGRHPDVARDLLGIGVVYRDMGDSSRAIGNLMRSLSIYEEQLGRYHAQTIEARNTLEALGSGEAY